MNSYVYLVPIMGLIGLLYTLWKFAWVSKQEAGTDRMKEIANYIAEGAMAFLKAEWKILTYFGIIVALLLGYMGSQSKESHWFIAVAFLAPLLATLACVRRQKPTFARPMQPVPL